MIMEGYITSYDIGTSGVKVVLLDMEGNAAGIATAPYTLLTPQPDWAEQDPHEYWGQVCKVTHEVLKKTGIAPEMVKAVVFNTQWKAAIPVDAEGNILHNAVIWLDGRARKQAEEINQRLGKPGYLDGHDYWCRLLWYKEELPEIYEKAETFLEVNSFLRWCASGEKYVDLTNDFIHSYDPEIQAKYDEIIDAAGLDRSKFPPMILSTDKAGVISEKASKELGLCAGTPLFGGGGDIPGIAIGSGCAGFEKGHIYLGSSGWFCLNYPKRRSDIGQLQLSMYKGVEMSAYSMQSVGMSLNWAIDKFYHKEKEEMGGRIFELINKEVAASEPGCRGLVATSWLHGERSPLSENAGAVYFNLRSFHQRGDMIRAMMEAICYMLRWKIDSYIETTGKKPEMIRVVGGGSLSDPWMQAMADVLGVRIEVPKNPQHAGAVGGAYCALIGLGLVSGFEQADEKICAERVFTPRKEYEALYQRQFEVYKEIFPRTRDLFDILVQDR